MDKRIILAVAGAGKTTHIVKDLSTVKRALIVTYTESNYDNLSKKIAAKYGANWADKITLMTYFRFLYRFCYRPFLADEVKAKGIIYNKIPPRYMKKNDPNFCITPDRYFYERRLALFLEQKGIINDIIRRIEKYFDKFYIDEVQDIAGRDFNFLEKLMPAKVDMLFVGDFYQHTFATSHDGKVNQSLFDNYDEYKKIFLPQGFNVDETTLKRSRRCSKSICDFVTAKLGIPIESYRGADKNALIKFVSDEDEIRKILNNPSIIKLHYQKAVEHGIGHKNWGDSKGEDNYHDVCVLLNKKTFKAYTKGDLKQLPEETRNKLYVAITRAHGNCFLIKGQ